MCGSNLALPALLRPDGVEIHQSLIYAPDLQSDICCLFQLPHSPTVFSVNYWNLIPGNLMDSLLIPDIVQETRIFPTSPLCL